RSAQLRRLTILGSIQLPQLLELRLPRESRVTAQVGIRARITPNKTARGSRDESSHPRNRRRDPCSIRSRRLESARGAVPRRQRVTDLDTATHTSPALTHG